MHKVGIFGGSFNPIHIGHINSMLSVSDKLGLSTVKVVPSNVTPLKLTETEQGPTNDERRDMVKLAIGEYPEVLELDDRELNRSGISYTIDTVNEILKEDPEKQLFLIIGADQFEQFDQWKDFKTLLELVSLVVTTRPGSFLPYVLSDFPEGLQPMVEDFDQGMTMLKTGREIYFVRLDDKDISASDVRKRLRSGRSVSDSLDAKVEKYIVERGFYNIVGDKVGDYKKFTSFCHSQLKETKSLSVQAFDLSHLDQPSEYTLLASGTSTRHTQSISEQLIRTIKDEYGVFPYGVEGKSEGRWVVIDYGSLMIHIFYDYVRQEYKLEDLWRSQGANEFLIEGSDS